MPKPPSPCGEGSGEGPARSAGLEPPPQPLPTGEGLARNSSNIVLAAVTGAHGVAGEVRLKLFGEGVEALKAHKTFSAGETGQALTLKKIRSDNKGGAIARFAEVADRGAAEKLRGTTLSVAREDLPALDEGEYYHADLIDLAVVTDAGDPVGTVANVLNYGATDLVEVAKPDGKTFLVPMTEQAVPRWDSETLVISADFAQ